jgi:hypothetical protein
MKLSKLCVMTSIQAMIPLVALMIRVAGIERTARWLTSTVEVDYAPKYNNLENAMRLFQTQRKAVANSFWHGNCLSRSLVLHWLLHKNGVNSEFRLGVRTQPSFKAHAWITFQERPLNASRQALSDYQLISDFKLLEPSKFE